MSLHIAYIKNIRNKSMNDSAHYHWIKKIPKLIIIGMCHLYSTYLLGYI